MFHVIAVLRSCVCVCEPCIHHIFLLVLNTEFVCSSATYVRMKGNIEHQLCNTVTPTSVTSQYPDLWSPGHQVCLCIKSNLLDGGSRMICQRIFIHNTHVTLFLFGLYLQLHPLLPPPPQISHKTFVLVIYTLRMMLSPPQMHHAVPFGDHRGRLSSVIWRRWRKARCRWQSEQKR